MGMRILLNYYDCTKDDKALEYTHGCEGIYSEVFFFLQNLKRA
jgi:hypothetical protein